MNECNSIETLTYTQSNLNAIPLSDQTKFRLNEINKIKNYLHFGIQERKTMSKRLSKYVTAFDYIDKIVVVLFAANGRISITSFTTVIGAPVRITRASFSLVFSLTARITKKLLKITRNKKKRNLIKWI